MLGFNAELIMLSFFLIDGITPWDITHRCHHLKTNQASQGAVVLCLSPSTPSSGIAA
jgi:hypothetical protein